jgi:hypothetical protein
MEKKKISPLIISSIPILSALLAVVLLSITLKSAKSYETNLDFNSTKWQTPSGSGITQTYPITIILYPDLPANLVYTTTDGTLIELDFPPHVTDITRTVAFSTHTNITRSGFTSGGLAFSLTSLGDGVADSYFVLFLEPVTLTIKYSDDVIPPPALEAESRVYYVQWTQWRFAEESCYPTQTFDYNVQDNTITGLICRPALYAYLGTHHQFLPVISR